MYEASEWTFRLELVFTTTGTTTKFTVECSWGRHHSIIQDAQSPRTRYNSFSLNNIEKETLAGACSSHLFMSTQTSTRCIKVVCHFKASAAPPPKEVVDVPALVLQVHQVAPSLSSVRRNGLP